MSRYTGELGRHFERIKEKLEEVVRDMQETPITVCILGPGEADEVGFKKRQQIARELNQLPGIQAVFPEDQAFKDLVTRLTGLPPKDFPSIEGVQFRVADAILALDIGTGVAAEVARYTVFPEIAMKLVDLLPQHYRASEKTSFAGSIRKRVQREYYSQDEFDRCLLATERCPQLVRERQCEKWETQHTKPAQ